MYGDEVHLLKDEEKIFGMSYKTSFFREEKFSPLCQNLPYFIYQPPTPN